MNSARPLSLEITPAARERKVARPMRLALVNMPWSWVDAPSIQCGLLQAEVRRAGHECDVHYLNIDLASRLGSAMYDRIAEMNDDRFHQLGEWLFSYAAFGDIKSEESYFEEYSEVTDLWESLVPNGLEKLVTFRRVRLPQWLDECVEMVDWTEYDAIGFSSTFLQNTASLAIGRRLKARFPDIPLIFGGANFDAGMGPAYAERLPWLDFVVSGEGDVALPALLDALAEGSTRPIPGVYRQGADPERIGEAIRTQNLDLLPAPDYEDYFATLAKYDRTAVLGGSPIRLPVEFSRGCWWGEKHHCTFCGLNNLGMNFRAKSPQRALEDMESLLRGHPSRLVYAVDNILDMKYLTSLCSELAEHRWDIDMFFEVKANLTREQLAQLKRAGIRRIQPGIESLSTHVLGLMRKGATKLINIRLLKWARYYGISTEWHVLSGFPCETDADYREQAELVPLLHHLQPPASQIGIWLERFSPYFMDSSFAIKNIRPQPSYQYVYPPDLDYSKIAYFFDYEADDLASDAAHDELGAAVLDWQLAWRAESRPSLFYERLPGRVSIIDTRFGTARKAVLEGWRGDAYVACGDTARSSKRIHQQLLDAGLDLTLATVTGFLDECCRAGIMVSEDDKYLGLALPENQGW